MERSMGRVFPDNYRYRVGQDDESGVFRAIIGRAPVLAMMQVISVAKRFREDIARLAGALPLNCKTVGKTPSVDRQAGLRQEFQQPHCACLW
jgi:hypothetical protein